MKVRQPSMSAKFAVISMNVPSANSIPYLCNREFRFHDKVNMKLIVDSRMF